MKIEYNAPTVIEARGAIEGNSFSIARTPHMFNVLSSALYSDHIGAVLREIGCNAADAHTMAGTPDRPFQVKLPSRLDPTFYIKDWGPGMDDEQVRRLYTTYGWSDKQSSDDVTGAFGLGSKSPFAYTDSFTVCAVKNGVKRTYTAYLDPEGVPMIVRTHEGPADPNWQSGLLVTFPVQPKDVDRFASKAADVYRWFKTKPEVLGLDNASLVTPEFHLQGDFFGLSRKDGPAGQSGVVMGNVYYPISSSAIRGELSRLQKGLLDSGIVLFLPIGEVMMTPSREQLQYTPRTVANLKKWLEKVRDELAKRLIETAHTGLPEWQWRHQLQVFLERLPYSVRFEKGELLDCSGADPELLKKLRKVIDEKHTNLPAVFGRTVDYDGADGVRVPAHKMTMLQATNTGTRRKVRAWYISKAETPASSPSELRDSLFVSFSSRCALVYDDASYPEDRARLALQTQYDTLLLVAPVKGKDGVLARQAAEALSALKGPLQGMPVIAASSLPLPQSSQRKPSRVLPGDAAQCDDEQVPLLQLKDKAPRRVALKDIDEANRFYAIVESDTCKHGLKNWVGDECIFLKAYNLDNQLRSIQSLCTALKLPLQGFVMVKSRLDAKKLRLEKLGFRPFLPTLLSALHEKMQPLAQQGTLFVWPHTLLDTDAVYRNDKTEVLALLTRHRACKTRFWKLASEQLADTELMRYFLDACPAWLDDSATIKAVSAWHALRYPIVTDGPKTKALLPSVQDEDDLRKEKLREVQQHAFMRAVKLLDIQELAGLANSSPEQAVQALRAILMLDFK